MPRRAGSRFRFITCVFAVAIAALTAAARPVSAQRAASIDAISPAAGRAGEVVTIRGRGFGAFNVRVTVGGVPAAIVAANGSQVTFRVPDGVAAGTTQVVATNPGSQSGSIAFRMLEGVLLAGADAAPAVSATVDKPPVRARPDDILNGTIMTRLDVRLRPGATVGQVNDALTRVEGGIVTMLRGEPTMTIAIPRPAAAATLVDLAGTLNAMPGISRASIANEAQTKRLPAGSTGSGFTELFHLVPEGFPAAWNASRLATDGCDSRKVRVVVADHFDTESYLGFFFEIPPTSFHFLVPPVATNTHGDEVTTTLAAQFAPPNPTGAVPFPECLDIEAVAVEGFSWVQQAILLSQTFPAGKFLLNYSLGYPDTLTCIQNGCSQGDLLRDTGGLAVDRAYAAADWKHFTSGFWGNFLLSVAGGNERAKAGTIIYPGLGVAAFDSPMSVATLPDPLFGFVQDGSQWDPQSQPNGAVFASMGATPPEKSALDQYVQSYGSSASVVADNALMVGAASAGAVPESLVARPYSDSNPDVFAVGENIYTLSSGFTEGGTSLATPQVTGLAAYLWLLSSGAHAKNPSFPDLSQLDPSVTRQAIIANARTGLGVNIIDAYSSALSLDTAMDVSPATAPVRLALLDVDENGLFNEDDLAVFINNYFDDMGNPVEPATPTYSRLDLNGDGYTGGSRTARFDLDRVGSTQFGAAKYSQVLQNIGGDVAFDENALTDLQILCYYAYSPLYTGGTKERGEYLDGRCAPVTVTVNPPAIQLRPGGQGQFAATVKGVLDPRVTWVVVPASAGTITDVGLLTVASSASGSFTVRAISVEDPTAFGEATVTVTGGTAAVALTRRSCQTMAVGVSGFFQNLLEPIKPCSQFPAAPYVPPAVGISNTVSVYTYSANYIEGLSASDINSSSISQGTFDAVTEVDVPAIDSAQIPTTPPAVRTVAQGSATFSIRDSAAYLLTISGTISSTNCCNNVTSLIIGYDSLVVPERTIKLLDPSAQCDPSGNCSFVVTQLMNTVDANGNQLPRLVSFGVTADSGAVTAGILENGQEDQHRKSEVSFKITFDKVQ